MRYINSSGLLTTFGGSQKIFSSSGPGSRKLPGPLEERREPLEAARNQAPEELRDIFTS